MKQKKTKFGVFAKISFALLLSIGIFSSAFAAVSWPASVPYSNSINGLFRDYFSPDTTNNRLGIGTNTPATRVDIYGTDGDANTQVVIDESGNLGINTDSPQEKLHLEKENTKITPENPKHVSAIFDDATTKMKGASSIEVSGKYAYITGANEDSNKDGVEILDISDPSAPTHVGAVFDNALLSLGDPADITVSGKYAYVTSSDPPTGEVQVLDISNPTSIEGAGLIRSNGTGVEALVQAKEIAISGKYAYVAGYGSNGMQIIDISDPDNPVPTGAILESENAASYELSGITGIAVQGKYAYIASVLDNGIEIVDVSDPTNPTHKGAISDSGATILGGASDIIISGKYAYVAASVEDGIEILDISNPASPSHVGSIADTSERALNGANRIALSGNYLYVAAKDDNGIGVIDVSNPALPAYVGSIFDDANTALKSPTDITIVGKYAYVTASDATESGMEILDISGIDAPAATIGSIETSQIFVNGNASVANNLYAHSAMNVGPGGIKSDGPLSIGPGNSYFGGKVLVGDPNDVASSIALNITGDINTKSGGYRDDGTCIWGSCVSDRNLKTDIVSLSHSLEKILQLNPVTFRFLDEKYGKGTQTGFIAQEVEEVFPDWVKESGKGYKTITYGPQIKIHLMKAIQELKEQSEDDLQEIQNTQNEMWKEISELQK